MLERILSAAPPFPAYLHRHVLQLYLIKHRRPPESETECRRAVYEYLTRKRKDDGDDIQVHVGRELLVWLQGEDEHVRGWGPVPRLAGIVHQFNRDLHKRYDLEVERDYKEFACYLALTVQGVLRWPEEIVAEPLRRVLWEPAPGIAPASTIGVTRALHYVRRHAPRTRGLDLSGIADFSQLLLLVLSDLDQGVLPSYTLSPEQLEYLTHPVKLKSSRVPLTGLLHLLVVERGVVSEPDLAKPQVAEAVAREARDLVTRIRMPERLRKAHGLKLATVTPIASAITAAEPVELVTVVGPLSHGSGLGAAARACVEAFQSAQIPVEVLNHVAGWGRVDEGEAGGQVSRIRGDINVIHFNPDVIIENLSRFGLEQFENRYNIGFCFWETSKATLAHRLGLEIVDELWVASEYCREVFRAATSKPVVNVGTPVPRMDDLAWANRAYFGLDEGAFSYLFTFDGASRFTRKHPTAAVEAFQRAFPGDPDARLIVKTQNTQLLSRADERVYARIRTLAREDRRIVILDESFSSNEVHGLISVCDCYVSLHRSEGFGFGMAEAMQLRVPVIATGYSGNLDFTSEETAYPVRYSLVPVPPKDFVYEEDGQVWADPDIAHAAERMIEVRRDPARAARVERAFERIQSRYGAKATGAAYAERIAAIRAELRAGARAA